MPEFCGLWNYVEWRMVMAETRNSGPCKVRGGPWLSLRFRAGQAKDVFYHRAKRDGF
jgi:hypothetical protein